MKNQIVKITLAMLQEHIADLSQIKYFDICCEYGYRINSANCTFQVIMKDDTKVDVDLENVIYDQNPSWYRNMYSDGKSGKVILNHFLSKEVKDEFKKLGIEVTYDYSNTSGIYNQKETDMSTRIIQLDEFYYAEGNSDS